MASPNKKQQKCITYLGLEYFELLKHGIIHSQMRMSHQDSVPILSANAISEVAKVLHMPKKK
jgi:hypothetical protein